MSPPTPIPPTSQEKLREYQMARDNGDLDQAAKLFAEFYRLVEREMEERAKAV